MKAVIPFIILTILSSCGGNFQEKGPKKSQRILIKESMSTTSCSITIVEIDGVEYMVNYHGGVCKLQK